MKSVQPLEPTATTTLSFELDRAATTEEAGEQRPLLQNMQELHKECVQNEG